jgi:hypothetical protein
MNKVNFLRISGLCNFSVQIQPFLSIDKKKLLPVFCTEQLFENGGYRLNVHCKLSQFIQKQKKTFYKQTRHCQQCFDRKQLSEIVLSQLSCV